MRGSRHGEDISVKGVKHVVELINISQQTERVNLLSELCPRRGSNAGLVRGEYAQKGEREERLV